MLRSNKAIMALQSNYHFKSEHPIGRFRYVLIIFFGTIISYNSKNKRIKKFLTDSVKHECDYQPNHR